MLVEFENICFTGSASGALARTEREAPTNGLRLVLVFEGNLAPAARRGAGEGARGPSVNKLGNVNYISV